MKEKFAALVLDTGSGITKAGFAGDEGPKSIFATVVGCPRLPGIIIGTEQKEVYVGEEAKSKTQILDLNYPINQGVITNWEDMERIWHHAFFNELKTPTDEFPILLSEAPLNPKQAREKTTEIMFETFNVPGFYLATQAVLALYASGKTTGLVLDSGDGITHAVPIYEGYAIPFAIHSLNVAGREISNYISTLLSEKNLSLTTDDQWHFANDIKEKLSYVTDDFEKDSKTLPSSEYELPDGRTLEVSKERILAGEALFKPQLLGSTNSGAHLTIKDSIGDCDDDIRKDFYANIVLAGGSTLMKGFADRLAKEMRQLAPDGTRVSVVERPEREYLAWIGGSAISSMASFQQMWISKVEYESFGPSIVQRKCF